MLWRDLKFGSPVPRPVEGAGYGIKTGAAPRGSGVIVVDLDSADAAATFAAFGPCPETYTVATPRGAHLYFAHPGFNVSNSVGNKGGLAPGIDIRGDGGFVAGPGSPHKSGGVYSLAVDIAPAPAPDWLLTWLRSRPASTVAQSYPGDVTDEAERAYRKTIYTKYLETTPPCIEGQGGDQRLFEVVQHGAYDLALPIDDVLELVSDVFDPRCVPPWGDELDERVTHKAHSAKTASTRPRAEPPPAALADIFTLEPPPKPVVDVTKKKRDDGIFWDDWDAPIEPPTWLVDGLIPVSTVGAFVAHGSSLKTWTAISLAAAVAQGVPWLDKYATRKGRALILDYESGTYEMRRRVRLLEGGKVVGLGAWSYPTQRVDDVEFWKRLAAIEGVSLLVIDSLAEGTTPGVDENDKAAAYPLQLAARYTEGTGASVLFIHHSKKDDGGDARKKVRGSTAIFAAMDWCYGFEPIDETSAYKRMHMECIKPCMGAKPNPVSIELTDEGLHLYESQKTDDGKGETDSAVQARILLVLQGGPITSVDKIAAACGMQPKRVRPEVKSLVVRGDVIFIEGKGAMSGYQLDSVAARESRVLFEVGRPDMIFTTEAQIAKASTVPVSNVIEMTRKGLIARSAEGRFLIVKA